MRSKKSKKREYTEVGREKVQKIIKTRTFNAEEKELPKRNFFIFRFKGDFVEGILGPPIVNYRRNSSYTVKLDDSYTIEIFGNKLLHDIIRENELVGSFVKIVYIGRQSGSWGRPRKIYRVYKVQGAFTNFDAEMVSDKHQYVSAANVL